MVGVLKKTDCPPLAHGDRLDQKEFHRRYLAYPECKLFELVGGVVYMASPLSRDHSDYLLKAMYWLETYSISTPGTHTTHDATTILGPESEPQPDLGLRILPDYGGQTKDVGEGKLSYIGGAPEFLAEIATSSKSFDLNQKKRDYRTFGVREYLVVCPLEAELYWFNFAGRGQLRPDKKGVYRSRVFPGLWLDGPALLALDTARVLETQRLGLASEDHAAFVALLQSAKSGGAT